MALIASPLDDGMGVDRPLKFKLSVTRGEQCAFDHRTLIVGDIGGYRYR